MGAGADGRDKMFNVQISEAENTFIDQNKISDFSIVS
jgi:hypothetical protein